MYRGSANQYDEMFKLKFAEIFERMPVITPSHLKRYLYATTDGLDWRNAKAAVSDAILNHSLYIIDEKYIIPRVRLEQLLRISNPNRNDTTLQTQGVALPSSFLEKIDMYSAIQEFLPYSADFVWAHGNADAIFSVEGGYGTLHYFTDGDEAIKASYLKSVFECSDQRIQPMIRIAMLQNQNRVDIIKDDAFTYYCTACRDRWHNITVLNSDSTDEQPAENKEPQTEAEPDGPMVFTAIFNQGE